MCGRLRVGKGFLHVCSIGRCSHVFGLLVRHTLISRPEFRFALSRLHAGALRALGLSAGDLRRHRFIGAAQDDDLVELAVLVSL